MSAGLPQKLELNNGGTNVYKPPDMDGAAKQVQMLKQLTGGKNKNKKGGNKIIVPPNGGTATSKIMENLTQITGQANANAKFDSKVGGGKRRRKTKKMKRSRKRSKKTRNPPFRKRWSQKLK